MLKIDPVVAVILDFQSAQKIKHFAKNPPRIIHTKLSFKPPSSFQTIVL